MGERSSNIGFFISIISVIVSVIGLIFGDDIVGKFSGPKLSMVSTKIDANPPNKESDGEIKRSSNLPDFVRVVEIKNEGSNPSKNLKLVLKTDGEIYDHRMESTENIKEGRKIDGKTLEISLDRLSANANLEVKVWMKNGDSLFKVSYADDKDSQDLVNVKEEKGNSILNYVFIFISIISTGFLVFLYVKRFSHREIQTLNNENIRLNNNVNSLIEAFAFYMGGNANENTEVDSSTRNEEATDRLQSVIDQLNSDRDN
ncbi:hypothetical protein MRP26_01225 [Bacillus sp. CCB-MMP212]|uniref:hypothetical protein n=1 Tax=Bacillus TaxID=1386 RepID=UPI000B4C14A4|nr:MULTISPECIES: hypothetical protein [Bacillus]MCI4247584.1 hypothetical protein [Bacillus sp. CCB-MMP212]